MKRVLAQAIVILSRFGFFFFLKEKNPTWSRPTLNYERSVTRRTLFMEENSDGDR